MISIEDLLQSGDARQCLDELANGPEEVRNLIQEATKENFLEGPSEAFIRRVKSLRPLSRKFIARTFEKAGYPMVDHGLARSLGFFGDWTPQ